MRLLSASMSGAVRGSVWSKVGEYAIDVFSGELDRSG